jgi:hypothetical protein
MNQTASILHELEGNLTRLLGAALALMAKTPFFMQPSLPAVSLAEFTEAVGRVEGQNRALILNGTFANETMHVMHNNIARITQLGVLGRVVKHLECSTFVLIPEEQALVVRFLGPASDSLFILGTRIVSSLLDPSILPTNSAERPFSWEQLMVDGALQSAREEIAATGTLSRTARRYARSTLWMFQVARDAMLTAGNY